MSASYNSLFVLLQIIYCWICNADLVSQDFYSIEWTSTISKGEDISFDTLRVYEMAVYSNGARINIKPTITGFAGDGSQIYNGVYKSNDYAFPNKDTFSVEYHFNGTLTPVDYIRFVTNCGDIQPSSFCNNSFLTVQTTAGTGSQYLGPPLATFDKYGYNIILYGYQDNCNKNTLLLDEQDSQDCSDWECSECLEFLHFDFNTSMMDTSTTLNLSSQSTTSQCDCPSFDIELADNNELQVWDINLNDEVAAITSGSNLDRVQITWTKWLGEERGCRQSYLPNLNAFVTIPSYRGLALTFTFYHTDGALDLESYPLNVTLFQLELGVYFNELFDTSWVFSARLYQTNKTSTDYGDDAYSYQIDVDSTLQKSSIHTLELLSNYNSSKDLMYEGIINLVSESFDTNSTYIEGLDSEYEIVLNSDASCQSHFETLPPIIDSEDKTTAIIIGACVGGFVAILVAVAIAMFVAYKRHLGCFKQTWNVKTDEDVDITDPRHPHYNPHEGQLDVDKKNQILTTNGFPTITVNTMKAGEPSGSNQKIPSPANNGSIIPAHFKQGSIRIVNIKPDPAKLRAKSLSKAESYDEQEVNVVRNDGINANMKMKIKKNVSERVLPDNPDPTRKDLPLIQQSLRAKDSESIYVDTESQSRHTVKSDKLPFDYGKNSMISKTSQFSNHLGQPRDSDYVYNQISQYSSPESSPSNNKNRTSKPGIIPLATIHQQPESKIDEALNQVTKNHKVKEFTNFDEELKLIKIIGEGSFGKVYKAKWDAEFVAVKIFTNINTTTVSTNKMEVATTQLSQSPKSQKWGTNGSLMNSGLAVDNLQITTIDDEQYKELYAEIVLATSIPPHPNIIRINGFCRKPLCVVMEYMGGGSVQKLVYGLAPKPVPSPAEKFVILVKACYGLAKLAEHGLHHRDVAARNILLGEYQQVIDENTKVKITDFGMTRKDNENAKEVQKTKNDGGPYKWMAPESIQSQEYNEKTDVYMFAITMWEIMYGREPYENVDAINAAMSVCMKDERPEFLWDLPAGLKTLIKKCWDKDPEKRPNFKFVAKKLEKLQKSMQSDIEENQAMDQVVEDERDQKYAAVNDGIMRTETQLSADGDQYDEY